MGQFASWTDDALLQAALQGEDAAWAELVGRYHGKGMRYLRGQVSDPFLAQDIMQNLWLAVVTALQREPAQQFSALFWTLLRRRLIDELRKKGRSKEDATLDAPVAASDPDSSSLLERQVGHTMDPLAETIRTEEEQLLHLALEQIPDHYRIVIQARQFEGRSNRETANLLLAEGLVADDGNVEKRVENYYYRGLKELKRQLLALRFGGGGSEA